MHKRKISYIVLNANTYFVLSCNVLALFTFYELPSGGKSKDVVIHCRYAIGATENIIKGMAVEGIQNVKE